MANWEVFKEFSNTFEAEAEMQFLVQNNVPARVRVSEPIPGMVEVACVMVPPELLHRARWVMAQQQFTDEELCDLATRESASPESEREDFGDGQ